MAVVGAVPEAGEASEIELAALVPPLRAALEECVGMMATHAGPGGETLWSGPVLSTPPIDGGFASAQMLWAECR